MARKLALLTVIALALALTFTSNAEARGKKGKGCSNGCNSCCNSCGSCCQTGCQSCCSPCGGYYAPAPAHHGKGGRKAEGPAPATILVNLPADARLSIDGYQTVSTSGTRLFTTPDLEEGKDFSYTLVAEIVREGKTSKISRKVTVRAGEETQVTLEESVTTAAK